MTRALIVNAYAIGNRGDAAIVQGLIESLRSSGATWVAVAARSWRTDAAEWRSLGADEAVPPLFANYDLPHWVRRARVLRLGYIAIRWLRFILVAHHLQRGNDASDAYRQAAVVISAGGAYLGGPRLILNLTKALNIAFGRVVGRPTIIAPMTINPVGRSVGRLLRWTFTGTSVFVRDTASQDLLKGLGVESVVVPDLAFRARPVRAAREAASKQTDAVAPSGYVCCAPRTFRPTHDAWAQRDQIERASAEAIASLMRSANVRLRFIAQVTATEQDDDRLAVERLRKLLPDDLQERVEVAEPAVSLEEAVAQYASCDVLLASRLHASLLAMATGVPSLVVGYEPKVVGVLSGLGLASRIVDARDPGAPEALANRLLSLMSPAERQRTLAAANTADAGFEPLDRELRTKLTIPVARSDRSGAVPKGDPSG